MQDKSARTLLIVWTTHSPLILFLSSINKFGWLFNVFTAQKAQTVQQIYKFHPCQILRVVQFYWLKGTHLNHIARPFHCTCTDIRIFISNQLTCASYKQNFVTLSYKCKSALYWIYRPSLSVLTSSRLWFISECRKEFLHLCNSAKHTGKLTISSWLRQTAEDFDYTQLPCVHMQAVFNQDNCFFPSVIETCDYLCTEAVFPSPGVMTIAVRHNM